MRGRVARGFKRARGARRGRMGPPASVPMGPGGRQSPSRTRREEGDDGQGHPVSEREKGKKKKKKKRKRPLGRVGPEGGEEKESGPAEKERGWPAAQLARKRRKK